MHDTHPASSVSPSARNRLSASAPMLLVAAMFFAPTMIAPAANGGSESAQPARPRTAADPEATQIVATIFDEYDRWQRAEFPEIAYARGDRSAAARLIDDSAIRQRDRAAARMDFRTRLEAVDLEKLSERDRVSHELLLKDLDAADAEDRHRTWLMPVSQRWGVHQTVGDLTSGIVFERAADWEHYLDRMAAVPGFVDRSIELMRTGLEEGRTPPAIVMDGVPAQIAALTAESGLDRLREPFTRLPKTLSDDERRVMFERLDRELMPALVAAVKRYETFMNDTYLPGCRTTIAAADYPDGGAFYADRLKSMTTTEMTAQEIHDLGLYEVDRIRSEMMIVIAKTDFAEVFPDMASVSDDERFAAFLNYLRTDPRFYFDDADALLAEYRNICKQVDAELPRLFEYLPRLPYGVKPVPDFIAPQQTTAYYMPGNASAGRSGTFFANTYALEQRPRYEMTALALHEAVPGHHLQIAIAQEMEDVPAFRPELWFTAYGEGWALYAERLGIEMGLYEDPYDDFGRLLYEMWRATRLVVDTGIHAFGWSRQEAIDFMKENTALSELNITTEVDRYISWPGQATAYKIGELQIRAMRRTAEEELGRAFDARSFHRILLEEGSVPLSVLERRVAEWIARHPTGTAYD